MEGGVPSKRDKSPRRKLVKFFEKSRDQWKATCQGAKALVKRLKNRVRFLERSRDQWKEKATTLEAELRQVNAAYLVNQQEVSQLKKTITKPLRYTMPSRSFSMCHFGTAIPLGRSWCLSTWGYPPLSAFGGRVT